MGERPFMRRTFRITRFRTDTGRDISDEIDFYLEMRTRELIDEGVEPEEARRRAERAFGDRKTIERTCSDIQEPLARRRQRIESIGALVGDLWRVLRGLRRRPAFASSTILTLAVCIALYTVVFGVVHSILLAPLPYPEPDRLTSIVDAYSEPEHQRLGASIADYLERREAVTAFEHVALYQARTRTVGAPGSIRRVRALLVTPSFLPTLGIEPLLGPGFSPTEPGIGAVDEVVLSHGFWRRHHGADPSIVGETLRVEGRSRTVVGIMPKDHSFPSWDAQLFLPIPIGADHLSGPGRFEGEYQMIARLRSEASFEQARSQVQARNAALVASLPSGLAHRRAEGRFVTRVVPLRTDLVRDISSWLYLLWGGATLLLLIGAISLASLFLVRSIGRTRELATRHALGAGRGRLVRELLGEGLVLALLGGGLGLATGALGLRSIPFVDVLEIPRSSEITLAPSAAASILGLALLIVLGTTWTAIGRTRRMDLFSVIGNGSSTAHPSSSRSRDLLTAAQIAVACILMVGAALLATNLSHLLSIDPGFDSGRVLATTVNLPDWRYDDRRAQSRFFDSALEDIRSLPGVTGAAIASQLPLTQPSPEQTGMIAERGLAARRTVDAAPLTHARTIISPDFFSVMGIPQLAGRPFGDGDRPASKAVAIVSLSVAEHYWGSADRAIGQRFHHGDPAVADGDAIAWTTVVGVVDDVLQVSLSERGGAGAIYLPHRQKYRRFARIVVATETEPMALMPTIRERIAALDPEVVTFWSTTLEATLAESLFHIRLPLRLLSIFAGVALFLAAIGIHGTLAQSVAQSRKEIGIRIALGSSAGEILGWILGRLGKIVAAGLALGLAGAALASEVMSRRLPDVGPGDPEIFWVVGAMVAAVALLAALIPARRATTVDPVGVLAAD